MYFMDVVVYIDVGGFTVVQHPLHCDANHGRASQRRMAILRQAEDCRRRASDLISVRGFDIDIPFNGQVDGVISLIDIDCVSTAMCRPIHTLNHVKTWQ